MDIILVRCNQLRSLLAAALERGLTPAFNESEIDALISDTTMDDSAKNRVINLWHKGVHELLYAPPSRG